jgi:hypothetical protein
MLLLYFCFNDFYKSKNQWCFDSALCKKTLWALPHSAEFFFNKNFRPRLCAMWLIMESLCAMRHSAEWHIFANISANSPPYVKIFKHDNPHILRKKCRGKQKRCHIFFRALYFSLAVWLEIRTTVFSSKKESTVLWNKEIHRKNG